MALDLKSQPDGLGYLYGTYRDTNGDSYRIDILPPAADWRGDMKPGAVDPTHWIIYVDGEEIGRVTRRADIATILTKSLPAPSQP